MSAKKREGISEVDVLPPFLLDLEEKLMAYQFPKFGSVCNWMDRHREMKLSLREQAEAHIPEQPGAVDQTIRNVTALLGFVNNRLSESEALLGKIKGMALLAARQHVPSTEAKALLDVVLWRLKLEERDWERISESLLQKLISARQIADRFEREHRSTRT